VNRPQVLFVPADIPLVTGKEIDLFIQKADRVDYCLGVASEDYLKRFYPRGGEPGIKMSYLYLRDQAYRINNLHIARLSSDSALGLIQKMYNHRHQKSFWNRICMIWKLMVTDWGFPVLSIYLLAQIAVLAERFKLYPVQALFRKSLLLADVEAEISRWLNIRFKVVEVNAGGAALDIDDEKTYKTILQVFPKWRKMLAPVDPSPCPLAPTG